MLVVGTVEGVHDKKLLSLIFMLLFAYFIFEVFGKV